MVPEIKNQSLKISVANQCGPSVTILLKILLSTDVTHKWAPQDLQVFITNDPEIDPHHQCDP